MFLLGQYLKFVKRSFIVLATYHSCQRTTTPFFEESFQRRVLDVMKGLEQAVRAQEESAKTQNLIVEQ